MNYAYTSKKKVWFLFTLTFVLPLVLILGIVGIMAADLPSSASIHAFEPYVGTKIYDINDELLYEFYKEKRIILKPDQIPPLVKGAFLAIEDASFYHHSAIDIFGILRAVSQNIFKGQLVQGGSTITQQLARNMYLTHERTMTRKIKEMVLAYKIEFNFNKEEILAMYLNIIYLSNGSYGVGAAAQSYFDKPVEELTVPQIALLAALAKGPAYSPYSYPERALSRRNLVLFKMWEEGLITEEEYRSYIALPIEVEPRKSHLNELAPYFIEEVRRMLVREYGDDVIFTGGLNVYTTLDPHLQELANEAVALNLKNIEARNRYKALELKNFKDLEKELYPNMILRGKIKEVKSTIMEVDLGKGFTGIIPIDRENWMWDFDPAGHFKPGDEIFVKYRWANFDEKIMGVLWEERPFPQTAFVGMDPRTGYVTALIGGADFRESQFNRATQSKLQIGSTVKPLFYTAAIDTRKYTMASVFIDAPFVWPLPDQNPPEWKVRNYNAEFRGPMTLRNAISLSVNVISAKLMREIGPTTAVEYLHRLGIESPIAAVPALSVGIAEVSPLELTRTFCTFANLGERVQPIFIRRITDAGGDIIKENIPQLTRVLSPQTAFIMNNMMKAPFDSGTVAFLRQAPFSLKGVVAGKTGTTDDASDLWLMAYTPEYVLGSWIGFDYKETLGMKEFAGLAHGEGFTKIINDLNESTEVKDWEKPEGIVEVRVDPWSGKRIPEGQEGGVVMYFYRGTEPVEYTSAIPEGENVDINDL